MKTAVIYAAMIGYDHGLKRVSKIIENTFTELGVEVESINLSSFDIPFYDGVKSNVVESIFNAISGCDGVVFACSASHYATSAIMQTFIEHFDFNTYDNPIKGKNVFTVVTSSDGSELRGEQYLASLIPTLGGAVINRLSIGGEYILRLGKDAEIKEMIEKYAEDYYRMLRQNRRFFVNSESVKSVNPAAMATTMVKGISDEEMDVLQSSNKKRAEELLGGINLDEFDKQQNQDIDELTQLLSKSYSKSTNDTSVNMNRQKTVTDLYRSNMTNELPAPVPHMKTCKQKTQSIIHYFQPQLARDINAIFQINVKGDEKFECYIEIKNGECEYYDGVSDNADISVYAQSEDWSDMLNGKYTTQKGFMTGKLKVRGNFILLSKFDQMFKLQP